MVNYQNGKIYMIESLEGGCRYYGATTQTLSRRLAKHKGDSKRGENYTSKKVLKYQDARILLVELFPCNSKMELEAKEAEYIRNNECVNKQIPQRTDKQYYQDNKEKIKQYRQDNKEKQKEYNKQYHQDNKEIIKEKDKIKYQKNKEKIKQRIKQYRQENEEKIAEKRKQHYQDNKEKIAEKRKQHYQKNKEIKNERRRQKRAEKKERDEKE